MVAVLFFIVITAAPVLASIQPFFYRQFVDGIPTLDYPHLFRVLIYFILVRVAYSLVQTSRWYVGDLLIIDALAEIRETVFSYIHSLDFSFHTNKSSGSLISALKRGDGAVWNIYHSIHYRLYDTALSFIIMLIVFAGLDSRIILYIGISSLIALLVTLIFVKFNIKFRKATNYEEDKISSVIVDNMINFETVKLFANEKKELAKLQKIDKNWIKAIWREAYTFRGLDLAMAAIIHGSLFFIIIISLQNAVRGHFTVGDFILVLAFLQTFYPKLWEVVWGLRDLAKSYTDIEKYFGILDNEIKVLDPEKPVRLDTVDGEIEFENVSFAYDKNQKHAVKNINLKIRQGQSVALVGKSGAGKTTLVKLLQRFFDVNEGVITLDGIDIKKFNKSDLRSYFGVVPQEPILFNNTIKYNIAYGRDNASKEEIVAASKMANIHDFIMTLPKKYNTNVGERGVKLSGGQKQRVAIARMILSDPDIVIFDEATSQLDSESERLIQEAFWKSVKDKTTLIIAHRLSTVMRADKIVVMKDGKIIEEGSHKALLMKKEGAYRYLWNLQSMG